MKESTKTRRESSGSLDIERILTDKQSAKELVILNKEHGVDWPIVSLKHGSKLTSLVYLNWKSRSED